LESDWTPENNISWRASRAGFEIERGLHYDIMQRCTADLQDSCEITANMSESMNREIIMNSQTKYNTCLFISSMLKIQTV